MAQIVRPEPIELMRSNEFVTVSGPACGAGGMILALVKVMVDEKLNPAEKLWAQCVDIHRLSALMCYVQLTLWNVPAELIVGNSLSLEVRERWYTPAHHLGLWSFKLQRKAREKTGSPETEASTVPADTPDSNPASPDVSVDHFDFTANAEQMGFEF